MMKGIRMADNKAVLAWANEVCTQALTEARNGDASLVNRVGANSAMKLFFDNVHGLKSVIAEAFPAYYSVQWKEITRLYEEYIRDEQTHEVVDKVSALEAKFDSLQAMVTEFIESQKQPIAPIKKFKAAKTEAVVETEPVVEAVEEVETEGDEADAESEA